jgi:DNA-binding CsgD family transcriptional regulator
MTRSLDTRLAVVDRWMAAYGERDIDGMCAAADPEIEVVAAGPVLSKLAGTRFHGHAGLRTLAQWSFDNYPALRLESSASRRVPGWILASATFVQDDTTNPVVKRHTANLFDVDGGRIRRVRTFLSGSDALAAARLEAVLTPRERQIFQLLAIGESSAEVARALTLSPATVRTHVQNAVTKLGAGTRLHALAIAAKRGEIQL